MSPAAHTSTACRRSALLESAELCVDLEQQQSVKANARISGHICASWQTRHIGITPNKGISRQFRRLSTPISEQVRLSPIFAKSSADSRVLIPLSRSSRQAVLMHNNTSSGITNFEASS